MRISGKELLQAVNMHALPTRVAAETATANTFLNPPRVLLILPPEDDYSQKSAALPQKCTILFYLLFCESSSTFTHLAQISTDLSQMRALF